MIQHQFSYWLTAKPNNMDIKDAFDEMSQALKDEECLWPAGPLVVSCDKANRLVTAEVNPSVGTVYEDTGIAERMVRVSRAVPCMDIELQELDEEDKSIQRLTWYSKGAVTKEQQSRLVPCNCLYDVVTVSAIADWIQSRDARLADEVRLRFLQDSVTDY